MSAALSAPGVPFRSARDAWLWTMTALVARRGGRRSTPGGTERPCDPDDVVKALDTLYRQRRIDLVQVHVLRRWGERGTEPSAAVPSEQPDYRLWHEALRALERPLRVKGIVA
jgi:hypothetical protein